MYHRSGIIVGRLATGDHIPGGHVHQPIGADHIQKWCFLSGSSGAAGLHTVSKWIGHGDLDVGGTWRVSILWLSYTVWIEQSKNINRFSADSNYCGWHCVASTAASKLNFFRFMCPAKRRKRIRNYSPTMFVMLWPSKFPLNSNLIKKHIINSLNVCIEHWMYQHRTTAITIANCCQKPESWTYRMSPKLLKCKSFANILGKTFDRHAYFISIQPSNKYRFFALFPSLSIFADWLGRILRSKWSNRTWCTTTIILFRWRNLHYDYKYRLTIKTPSSCLEFSIRYLFYNT